MDNRATSSSTQSITSIEAISTAEDVIQEPWDESEPGRPSLLAKRILEHPDIRTMVCEILGLTQADMEAVVFDEDIPVVIRRFALSILQADTKEIISIVDQAYGKPIERQLKVTQQANPLKDLSTEQLKALLYLEEEDCKGDSVPLVGGYADGAVQ